MPEIPIPKTPPDPRKPDPVETALPLDDVADTAVEPASPALETSLDDDEGGAEAVDPETGLPYDNADAGTRGPLAHREGGPQDT
jgi:hypothetical protein